MKQTEVLNLLELYKISWQLFYLPYGGKEEAKEEYEFRKEILKKLNEELDRQYSLCFMDEKKNN